MAVVERIEAVEQVQEMARALAGRLLQVPAVHRGWTAPLPSQSTASSRLASFAQERAAAEAAVEELQALQAALKALASKHRPQTGPQAAQPLILALVPARHHSWPRRPWDRPSLASGWPEQADPSLCCF